MEPSKGSSIHKTRTTNYWYGNDGILRSKVIAGAIINIEDAIENERIRNKLIGDERRLILIDIREINKITQEARNHTQKSANPELLVAAAILVGSPLTRIIGSFAMGFNKPLVPTKLFTSEEEALHWLNGFIDN